jgi:acyl-CoA synthetase (AMP-forming)/AMP-acid ligase II
MTIGIDDLTAVRTELRERWYRDGWFTERTIPDELEAAARRWPDAGFVFASEAGQSRRTFPEMLELARRVAGGLQELGVGRGDVVAIQVPNREEMVAAYYAAYLAGAVVVPIVHIYGPSEVSFILRQSRATVLVVPDRWRSIDYAERVGRLTDVPDLRHVVVVGARTIGDSVSWARLAGAAPAAPVPLAPDDVCTILYTSGTTSAPKGVQHTHNTLLAEMRSVAPMMDMREGDTKLVPWPAGHIAGLIAVLTGLVSGTTGVLMDRWDVNLAVRLVEEHRIVCTSGTPLHIAQVLDAAAATGADIGSLRLFQVGGATVPRSLLERAERAGVVVGRAYGSTEHPTVTSPRVSDPFEKRLGTDGRPYDGERVRIVDESGADVPEGADGEVALQGPAQFIGYRDFGMDEEAFLPGGWFLTGDIGRLDADGYLTITDRRKDIIIRGGENIPSREVEEILARHPAISEAAVVAEPDDTYGERVAAFVLLREGAGLDLEEVRSHFRAAGVAPQKTPERLIVVSDLPRTPSGKVQKFALRTQLRGEHSAPA